VADHHPTLPPSSFPGFSACPQYVRAGGSSEAMDEGTEAHAALSSMLLGKSTVADYDGKKWEADVEWAMDIIREITGGFFKTEFRLSLFDGDFDEITFGTTDVVCKSPCMVIDYKSGYPAKSYKEQLELYAAAWMDIALNDNCECVLIYGAARKVEKWYVSYREARDRSMQIIESVKRGDPAKPCEFCEWCAKRVGCEAVNAVAVKVATGYVDSFNLAEYHASAISDPAQMAKALYVAGIMDDWAKSVKHHAKELAKGGAIIPGYGLKDGRTNREIIDIQAAYKASGMSAEQFLSCCSASVPDLEKIIAEQMGNKSVTKPVKEELNKRLGALIETKRGDQILAKEKK
jgi:hypothetical protein